MLINDEADLPATDSDSEDLDYLKTESSSLSDNSSDSDDSTTESDEGLFDESEMESEWDEGASEPIGEPGSLNMPIEILRSIQRDLENIKETQEELVLEAKPVERQRPRKAVERPLTSESGTVRGSLKGMLRRSKVSRESDGPRRLKTSKGFGGSRRLKIPREPEAHKRSKISSESNAHRGPKAPKRSDSHEISSLNRSDQNKRIFENTTRRKRKWPRT
ncbi:hypothetical protein PSACC_00280 [Paramicrosporidium saccamoebae]|uniref:Uncharacterized protein n=1 Tax=Paramicrosporidium saccamoebae TaxID=1246581 RepID=A0A2H9TQG2_9FUNG|nr:hypothetical protein PSACC_00280 [Paramicrosporidium saccamoebae]